MAKTVLYNAKVYVERDVFAEAVYQEDGIIKMVGTNEEVLAACGDAERIDCQGKTILPGLNDSHMHLMFLGKLKMVPAIGNSKNIDEMIDMCKKYFEENPDCGGLYAMGWNQDKWENWDGHLPDRHDLDKISTEVPIVLARACGHSSAANTKALELAGITAENNKVQGGDVILEDDGVTPNGYLCEKAGFIARNTVPEFTREQYKTAFKKAMEYAVSVGLTSVQSNDAGQIFEYQICYDIMKEVYEEGDGLLRYCGQLSFPNPEALKAHCESEDFKASLYGDMLTYGPLKILKDGSLGARTAMMRNGYADDPDNYGVETDTDEYIQGLMEIAQKAGMQTVIHCIGDDAIERMVKLYEKMNGGEENPLRHSIIHCQITDMPLMEEIKRTNTLIAYQPAFLPVDMYAVVPRCGEELAVQTYAFGTAAKMDIRASYGTDCPVEDCNPFESMYAAITRKDLKGSYMGVQGLDPETNPDGCFVPSECVDVFTAVDAYTIESAYHEFREDVKGRIKAGYYADMIVLDKDIFTCDPMDIKDIKPEITMVGGKIVYHK